MLLNKMDTFTTVKKFESHSMALQGHIQLIKNDSKC